MRIDLQIPAHLGKEVATDLLLSILEGGVFSSEIHTAMASLSLVGHECAVDLLLTGEPTEPATRIPHPSQCYGRTVLSECQAPIMGVATTGSSGFVIHNRGAERVEGRPYRELYREASPSTPLPSL
jgi:hypothetical protein